MKLHNFTTTNKHNNGRFSRRNGKAVLETVRHRLYYHPVFCGGGNTAYLRLELMEVYNLILLWGRVKQLARFSTENRKTAEKEEKAVHDLLKAVQVDVNKPRLALRRVKQLAFLGLVYVAFEFHGRLSELELILLVGLLGRLSRSFSALVKVGISNNTERRLGEINENIENGGSEWACVPVLLVPFIPLLTWSQVRPVWAAVGVASVCFFVFWLLKHL